MEPLRCLPTHTAADAPCSVFACHVMYLIRGGEATYLDVSMGQGKGREGETVGGEGQTGSLNPRRSTLNDKTETLHPNSCTLHPTLN